MPDDSQPRPYGLFGLTLSLPALAVLTALYAAGLGALAALYGLATLGPSHLMATLRAGELAYRTDGLKAWLLPLFLLGLGLYAALFAAVATAAYWRGGRDWRRIAGWLPWSPRQATRAYWILLAIGVAYGLAASVALSYAHTRLERTALLPRGLVGGVVTFVLIVIAAPATEEILFRGWIFTSLRTRFSFWTANVVSAALFAVAHWEKTHLYALAVFPLGLMLGHAREAGGSARASALFHGLYNAVALSLTLIGPS